MKKLLNIFMTSLIVLTSLGIPVFADGYSVTYPQNLEHGNMIISPLPDGSQNVGDEMTITFTLDEGYAVNELTITNTSKSENVVYNKTSDTTYTFLFPEGNVSIEANLKSLYDTKATDIEYSVDEIYEWSVPDSIDFTSDSFEGISATGNDGQVKIESSVIRKNKQLMIAINSNQELTIKDETDHELSYSLFADGEEKYAGETIVALDSGESCDNAKANITATLVKDTVERAGDYSGTLGFVARLYEIPSSKNVVAEGTTATNVRLSPIDSEVKAQLKEQLKQQETELDSRQINNAVVLDIDADTPGDIILDVSDFAQIGETVLVYHKSETRGWEVVGMARVDATGLIKCTFEDYSPVIIGNAGFLKCKLTVTGQKPFEVIYDSKTYGPTFDSATNEYKYERNVPALSEITLSYDNSNNDFVAWIKKENDNGTIENSNSTFTISNLLTERKIKLETINIKENHHYARYMAHGDQMVRYGEFTNLSGLKNMAPPSAPGKLGYEFIDWMIGETKLGDITSDAQLEEVIKDLRIVELKPSYKKLDNKFILTTMTLCEGLSTPTQYGEPILVDEGNATTLEAPEIENMYFAYWTLGSDIVSYSEKYQVIIVKDSTYVANYKTYEVEKKPVITADLSTTGSGANIKLAFTITRSVPENAETYQIIENGILYAANSSWGSYNDTKIETSLRFDDVNIEGNITLKNGTYKAVNNVNTPNETWYATIGVSNVNRKYYLRGYMIILKNNADDSKELLVLYTDVYVATYNTAKNPHIIKTQFN